MRAQLWVGLALALVLGLGFYSISIQDRSLDQGDMSLSTVAEKRALPAFAAQSVDGRVIRSQDFQGKVVLINFWATWCPACMAEMPHLIDLYRQYQGQGFEVLSISMDEDGQALAEYLTQQQLPFPVLRNTEELQAALGPVNVIPTSILVNREGDIVRSITGYKSGEYFSGLVSSEL